MMGRPFLSVRDDSSDFATDLFSTQGRNSSLIHLLRMLREGLMFNSKFKDIIIAGFVHTAEDINSIP